MDEPPEVAPQGESHISEEITAQAVEEMGDPGNLEEIKIPDLAPGPVFSRDEHRAKATKQLALLLLTMLFVIFAAHFISILCLAHNKPNAVEEVSRVFNTWIPIYAGLFGSAATFYFTQKH